jgi:hypothetical protein
MKTMAQARMPASNAAHSRSRRCASSSGCSTSPVRADTLLRLDHPFVQQLGQHDVAVEQARPRLVGDAQRVAKAACGDQQRAVALAFQQALVATVVPIFTQSTARA